MRFIKYQILILSLLFISIGLYGQEKKIQRVGEEIFQTYESPHPYKGVYGDDIEAVHSQEITSKGASYIAVHFNKVQLAKGDFIVVKSPDGERTWQYSNLNVKSGSKGLWSVHIYGETAVIEIHSKNIKGSYGYSIDKIARGFSPNQLKNNDEEAICGQDDSREAVCYQNTEPQAYDKAMSVARLMINGVSACTGWLIGSDGHLMTNNHCIQNASDANNVTIEFMAEGNNCNTNCQSWFACQGVIRATSATLIQTNVALDYSLLALPNNVSATYGFLQLRGSGPVLNERIYVPQHPGGWGKRIAINSDVSQNGFAAITSLSEPRCTGSGNGDVGYFADTRGGSSGSPVISYADNLVVALHHCANCPNRGVPVDDIINDLGANLPTNAIGGDCETNITHTGTINSGTYKASNSITSSATVNSGNNVTYQAGNNIRLNTGFIAKNGSTFFARISGCSANLDSGSEESVENKTDEANNEITFKNYPNPFTGQTTIEFILSKDTPVTLFVSDLTGRQIVMLLDNEQRTQGTHLMTFDGSKYAAGMYYYTIQAGEYTGTQKMILVK